MTVLKFCRLSDAARHTSLSATAELLVDSVIQKLKQRTDFLGTQCSIHSVWAGTVKLIAVILSSSHISQQMVKTLLSYGDFMVFSMVASTILDF